VKTTDVWLVGFRPEVRMLARVATFAQAPAPADAPAVNGLRDLVRDFDAVPEPIAGTCPAWTAGAAPGPVARAKGRSTIISDRSSLEANHRLRAQLANDLAATQRRLPAAEKARHTAVATLEQAAAPGKPDRASRSGKGKVHLPPPCATERSPSSAAPKRRTTSRSTVPGKSPPRPRTS
jgi:hypothetical protein